MSRLGILARDGAFDILRRLSTGKARFRDLNEVVTNTRTLTRRLGELLSEGLIARTGGGYEVTRAGFDIALSIEELGERAEGNGIDPEELAKIRYTWMRVSLRHLVGLFRQEFGDELVSVVLYGSAAKGSFELGRSDIDLLYILEDDSRNVWQREERVFKEFQSVWEYRACDYWLRGQGFYGYPETATVWLQAERARAFQPVYLDMLSHRAVLYDKGRFFRKLMDGLKETLKALGTVRIESPDGAYGWLLKPDLAPGELIEIRLG